MTDAKAIIQKRLNDFKAAEASCAKALQEYLQLHDQVVRKIETTKSEKQMNSAGRQTCEQLLKELTPAETAPTDAQVPTEDKA